MFSSTVRLGNSLRPSGTTAMPREIRRRGHVTWVNSVIQGLLLGGQYALIACGLSLAFGVMRIVNLAHGDLAVCGAYLGLVLSSALGVPVWVTLPLLLPAAFAAGVVLQVLLFGRALRGGPRWPSP